LHHFVLGGVNVVGDAVKLEGTGFGVIDGVAGTGVAVTGLPHATGIDDEAVFAEGKANIGQQFAGNTVTVFMSEDQGHVRVTYQTICRLEEVEILAGDAGGGTVLPDWLARAAVYQREVVFLDNRRQVLKVADVLGEQLPGGPAAGGGGIGVEVGEVEFADGSPVVIAGDADVVALSQKLETLVRVRAVADYITQTPYLRHLSPVRDVLQHGGKGSQIGMNISHNGVTHPIKL